MGIHDDLSQRIVRVDGFAGIARDVLQESYHGGDSGRMDAVLGLFKTEDALNLRVLFKHGKSKESQRSIGERAGRMRSLISSYQIESE